MRARSPIIPGTGRATCGPARYGARHKGRQLAAAEVDKVRGDFANYRRFADVTEQIVAVNGSCEARPPNPVATAPAAATGDERGLRDQIAAAFAAEVERLAALAADSLGSGAGVAPVELAIRTAMIQLGAELLQQLVATDTGHRGPRIDCGEGASPPSS